MTEVRRLTVKELSQMQGFRAVAMPDADREISGIYIGDLLSWVMGRAKADDAWITIMSNINIIAVASLADVSCIILSEGVTVDDDIIATARQKDVNILSSALPSYETAVKISQMI